MSEELELLYRLILDCNEVALRRGDKYGLCDSIDNEGNPYPSMTLAEVIDRAVKFEAEVDRVPEWRSNKART